MKLCAKSSVGDDVTGQFVDVLARHPRFDAVEDRPVRLEDDVVDRSILFRWLADMNHASDIGGVVLPAATRSRTAPVHRIG